MLRDNPVGLIDPMFSSAGANPLALCIARNESSDDRPPCLENPRPEGAELTLTENAPSPFHAEPKHFKDNYDKDGERLDKLFNSGSLFKDFLRTSRDMLHSLTHSGTAQLQHR
jgi:hypothetical protein